MPSLCYVGMKLDSSGFKGKIKNLLGPQDVTNSTKLILINAIYFKAEWEAKFKAEDTKLQPFRLSKVSSSCIVLTVNNLVTTAIAEIFPFHKSFRYPCGN